MVGKGNTYQQLIDAALRSFEETGQLPQNVQELARTSGLTGNEIRDTFSSADKLRSALIDHGTVLLSDAIGVQMVKAQANDPREQLRALYNAYFKWGGENRTLFGLLATGLIDPNFSNGSSLQMHRQSLLQLTRRKLKECRELGLIPEHFDLNIMAANAHSLMLGISAMLLYNKPDACCSDATEDAISQALRMMDLYLDQTIAKSA